MKRKVIITMCFIPAVVWIICILIAVEALGFSSIDTIAWLITAMLIISALLMYKNKWWGCLFGIAVGAVWIYMGTRETGQIINESPVGIAVCLYYLICGSLCYKNKI